MICMWCTAVVGLSGLGCIVVMYYAKDQRWTKVERVTVIARIHRWSGYIMLFFGNIVVSGGLTTYINTLETT